MKEEALERALGEMVRRHEVLRTVYRWDGERVVQEVREGSKYELSREDLRERSREERAGRVRERGVEAETRGYDLERDPMLRVWLLRFGKAEWAMWVSLHHIATDGWSLGVWWEELSALYGAYCEGRDSELEEPEVQYGDYAIWQRERLTESELDGQLEYWKGELAGVPLLELATDRRRPAVQSYRGGRCEFELGAEVASGVRELSREEGATAYMTLLAGFVTLLYRYTRQEGFGVGMPVANRERPEVEGLIGFFVNTLVVRTKLGGEESFRELVGAVKEKVLAAQEHEEVPFEKVVEVLKPERDLSRNPLFQVVFAQQERGEWGLSGLEGARLEGEGKRVRFDVEIHVWEGAEGIRGEILYNRDLFEEETVKGMAGHYVRLVREAVTAPEMPLCRIVLTGLGEALLSGGLPGSGERLKPGDAMVLSPGRRSNRGPRPDT